VFYRSSGWRAAMIDLVNSARKENRMRKLALLLIAFSAPAVVAGCGSGVTIEGEPPIEVPERIEVGGVTVQTPDQINVGDTQIESEDGRVTVK
jgi:hypothetical protein